MKVEIIIRLLIKYKLNYFAYFLLSLISIFLGRFSTFRLMENNLWLQKQGKVFFCDYSPNYRLNAEKEESFSHEIFFHGYRPRAGDTCVDIGAGLGLDTRLMSGLIGNEGKVFSIEATDRTFKALEVCINKNKLERIKYKPGCIPPYIALNMPEMEDSFEAEKIYLKEIYIQN